MHLPWGMICFAGFQLYFPTFPSPLNTNSIFYQNKTHALRPCATNCHKILRTWCKNSIFCKTPNNLLQIQRAPTRARQSPSIPTVVATQSPTTKGHLHLHTSNEKPHPRMRQNNVFVCIFCFFSTRIKRTSTTIHLQCNSNQRQTAERSSQKTPTHFLRNSTLQQMHGLGVPDSPHLVSNPKQQRILHIEQTPTT